VRHALRSATLAITLAAGVLRAQEPATPPETPSDSSKRGTPAESATGSRVFFQPTATSYSIGDGASAYTVEQAAMPLVIVLPFHRRFTMDVTSAGAYTRVVEGNTTRSEVYGSTDTQVRADLRILMDHLSLTLGINAPSGTYKVSEEQVEAAGRIGNDFLFFPISSMGNGPAGTVGLAAALRFFHINLGVGGSVRKSMEFEPVQTDATTLRYQPADETRLRVSAERRLWIGTASVAVISSTFGEDKLAETTYSTGNRVITTAAWTIPFWRLQLDLGLWNIARARGEQLGGPAPGERIRNYSGALGLRLGNWVVQPMLESRRWVSAGNLAGEMQTKGIGISIPMGRSLVLEPRYTMTTGTLYSPDDATPSPLAGWQGSLLMRRR
jgi:hypothetical protein